MRSGALARLELTRDMVGNGWSMKRGTILVGSTKGGEYDRAYVAIIGFIDPESGRFVKLGGDVLGGDGAAGLKGKARQAHPSLRPRSASRDRTLTGWRVLLGAGFHPRRQ